MSDTDDFFRSRLDQMIDLRQPLSVLASRMPWQEIEASVAHLFAHRLRSGKAMVNGDLFGTTASLIGAGVSKAGRPRLMISLLYLKDAFNESEEGVVERWAKTQTWQYLSGPEYFEHLWPCVPTAIGKFHRLLGEECVEKLLTQTINVDVTLKLITKKDLAQVFVDSTVQQNAVAHPTDSKLPETARGDADNPGISIKHRGKRKQLNAEELKLLKRRQAIEPVIGHLKQDHRMDRCTSRVNRATGCMRWCVQPATTFAGCCA